MCGITGIINGSKNSHSQLEKMLDSISHRGPDDQGTYESKKHHVFIGSRRLSIIDLSKKGKMPMYDENKTVVVCQNGEIYNYTKLKRELIKLGHKFISS